MKKKIDRKFLGSFLDELRNRGVLEPEHTRDAMSAVKEIDHALDVRDMKALTKAVDKFLRVFVIERYRDCM